ncbi:hypothetical protein [Solitalea koreensis]|uniref:Natural product n=1 Tax=Solitalea koreensis TaxID=543615 RepID=A0A521CYI1_9SPHI|nr:hypothetical protein [Solitalea koreensis]SMO64472.1 hypothetical protein SAMN06265350_10545 [Solitalea koreensis]
MKKLSLTKLDLASTEVLTREQLKFVLGGEGSGGCPDSECDSDNDCKDPKWPYCYKATCITTGLPSNTCGLYGN